MSTSTSPTPDPKEAVRQDWLGAAPAWKKWYSQLAFQSRQATELVVQGAALSPGMHVLDLASGSGEPALSVAAAVGPQGRVIATDLLREMLDIAEENASARGIKNIDFRAADAEQLPFPGHMFDRITAASASCSFPTSRKPSAKCAASSSPAAASLSSPGAPWKRIHSSAR